MDPASTGRDSSNSRAVMTTAHTDNGISSGFMLMHHLSHNHTIFRHISFLNVTVLLLKAFSAKI